MRLPHLDSALGVRRREPTPALKMPLLRIVLFGENNPHVSVLATRLGVRAITYTPVWVEDQPSVVQFNLRNTTSSGPTNDAEPPNYTENAS